jgi:hypothetical protein
VTFVIVLIATAYALVGITFASAYLRRTGWSLANAAVAVIVLALWPVVLVLLSRAPES